MFRERIFIPAQAQAERTTRERVIFFVIADTEARRLGEELAKMAGTCLVVALISGVRDFFGPEETKGHVDVCSGFEKSEAQLHSDPIAAFSRNKTFDALQVRRSEELRRGRRIYT